MTDSFGARSALEVGGNEYEIFRLDAVKEGHVDRLPYSLKVLLENLLRHEDGRDVTREDVLALANWDPKAAPSTEISFTPARVILQDFTGVPAVVDLAAMRDAVVKLGGSAADINPLSPAELVIDHSVQVDNYGAANSLDLNNKIEFQRNKERYSFLRWGQSAFENFRVVPPNTGIVHQVNLEYLSRVVFDADKNGVRSAYPDTVVGTDSHTTMINGLGILGWGVGGIEAEAAMLGQPITMLIPNVVGFKLTGKLREGTTATDLVLTVTEMLREKGVVGKFVEFFGDGLAHMPLADRATLGNMSPEFGSTCGIFPIDGETIRYLELSGRDAEQCALIEAYAKEQGMWRYDGAPDALYSDTLELDMGDVVPSIAGPKRPQDRIALTAAAKSYAGILESTIANRTEGGKGMANINGQDAEIRDGAILIAAITSCTNTSNPAVMLAAGLVAKKAAAKGLKAKPWVKTSLAPGSRVVTDYLEKSGLLDDLGAVGFFNVGYGCTTCIGNSGPLKPEIAAAVQENDIVGTSVLSGNRNFEGRIHALVQHNFLASPPLVVAYSIAGNMDVDLFNDSLGNDQDGNPVYMKDIWPTQAEVQEAVVSNIDSDMFQSSYSSVFEGDANWKNIDSPEGEIYTWDADSTYVKNPPYFEGMSKDPSAVSNIEGARALALLGDSVTTDHISPAGGIAADSPAAEYLKAQGVKPSDFNSYGSPGTEGGWTCHQPSGEQMSIFDASVKYREEGTPLVVIAGSEYGTGSSRDWAAKGTVLLGVKAVITKSFERIHRSNLIGMGVLPLQFVDGQDAGTLGLTGKETYSITGQTDANAKTVTVTATPDSGDAITFEALVRIDTPKERDYYENGGILHYVLRQLAA
jgi:aconitate hydratase